MATLTPWEADKLLAMFQATKKKLAENGYIDADDGSILKVFPGVWATRDGSRVVVKRTEPDTNFAAFCGEITSLPGEGDARIIMYSAHGRVMKIQEGTGDIEYLPPTHNCTLRAPWAVPEPSEALQNLVDVMREYDMLCSTSGIAYDADKSCWLYAHQPVNSKNRWKPTETGNRSRWLLPDEEPWPYGQKWQHSFSTLAELGL